MAELCGQLAGVSAVLAGFAITFLALLLGHWERSRRLSASIALAVAASASLLVSALGWTLISSFLTQVGGGQGTAALQEPGSSWLVGGRRRGRGVRRLAHPPACARPGPVNATGRIRGGTDAT